MINSIWLRLLSDSTYHALKKMGVSELAILKWQRKRFILPFLLVLLFRIGFLLIKPILVLGAILSGGFIYFQQDYLVNKNYLAYRFERNLEFSKFARLVIPYLRQAKYGISVYQILSQMIPRMNHEADKQLLRSLMVKITENANDITPYIEFAEKMGGTDFAVTFMSLLYDVSKGATDDRVINELGQEVSKQLLHAIEDIIAFKQSKFMLFPTKLTIVNFVLFFGYLACVLLLKSKNW